MDFETGIESFTIRRAEENDHALIHSFIKKLSVYEKMESEMVASPEDIRRSIFERKEAEVLLAFSCDDPVGFAIYCHHYSTFLGGATLYLEDLFVDSDRRGRGYGKALLRAVAQVAKAEGCGRLEWSCLNWNKPSIDFYLSIGAKPMSEWTVYRLTDYDI